MTTMQLRGMTVEQITKKAAIQAEKAFQNDLTTAEARCYYEDQDYDPDFLNLVIAELAIMYVHR